jgi:hypothetical protein
LAPDTAIDADPGVRGLFQSYQLAGLYVANVINANDSITANERKLLPTLYSPRLETSVGDGMIPMGEQIIDGKLVAQHWSVKFLSRAPPIAVLSAMKIHGNQPKAT